MQTGYHSLLMTLTAVSFLTASQWHPAGAQELKGPIGGTQSTSESAPTNPDQGMAGLGAPGAGAIMTQDMLLVNPTDKSGKASLPITGFIGMTLKMDVNRAEVKFKDLKGLAVTVSNDTNRPLVINADEAVAKVSAQTYKCASLTQVQLAVNPEHGIGKMAMDMIFKVAPAAASIGVVPTAQDFIRQSKPPLERYGKDQERRVVESTRFGKRILWPREKTQGIIYFNNKANLDKATIEIPVATLFDKQDSGTLVASP